MLVRHQLGAARHLDPDHVGTGFRGMADQDREASRSRKSGERFPLDVFREDRPEGRLVWLMDARHGVSLNQVEQDVDIALRRFGVWAKPFRFFNERLGNAAVQVRQADIELSTQGVLSVCKMQVHFCVDGECWHGDLSLAGRNSDRALEAGRPSGDKKLLRIAALARRAGQGKLDVQAAIRTARLSVFASTDRVNSGYIDDFSSRIGRVLFQLDDHGFLSLLSMRARRTARRRLTSLANLSLS